MTYNIEVDDSIELEISEEQISNLDVVETSQSKFHILENNKTHNAEIVKNSFYTKSYSVAINNTIYKVKIEDKLDSLISDMGFAVGSKKQINSIIAPMPGLILDIPIKVGDSVNENDVLLILEAMKMENSITSPVSGTIKSIEVEKGDAVDKNQLLLEFE